MKKLIRDAAKMTEVQKELGITVDASSMSFDNIIKAISVMQKHLGIAGTTAAEAGQTFKGSFTMMKASWENLKIAMVDPEGNVNEAIQNLVDSTKTFAENAFPLFSNALKGIATAVKQLAPQIGGALPQMITDLLPDLAAAAVSLITGLVKGIVDNLPLIADAASKILDEISRVFKESDSPVLQLIGEALGAVKDVFDWLVENQQIVVTAITAIIGAFAIAKLVSILSNLNPISLAIGAIATAATLIIENWASIEEFFVGLWEGVKTAVDDAWTSVKLWWTNIKQSISEAWSVIATWFDNTVWTPLTEFFTVAWGEIQKLWTGIKEAISAAWSIIADWFDRTVWQPLKDFFDPVWSTIELLWTGVKEAISTAWATIADWFDRTVWQPLKGFFDPVWSAIELLWTGVKESISAAWATIADWFDRTVWQPLKGFFEPVWNAIKKLWEGISGPIEQAWNSVLSVISPIIDGIKGVIDGVVGTVQSVINWFEQLMGFNGKDLSETTSGHTHTNTTINKVYNEPMANLNQSTGILDAGVNAVDAVSGQKPGVVNTVWDALKTAMGWKKNAKGNWAVPYDDYPALLHRNEMVLTASQARRYKEGEGGMDVRQVAEIVGSEVRKALKGVGIYMGADKVADLTANRMNNNIGLMNAAILHGMGG